MFRLFRVVGSDSELVAFQLPKSRCWFSKSEKLVKRGWASPPASILLLWVSKDGESKGNLTNTLEPDSRNGPIARSLPLKLMSAPLETSAKGRRPRMFLQPPVVEPKS